MAITGIAIVGTGFIGPVHVEALLRLGLPVVGILGSTPEKSVAAARRFGLPRGYPDYQSLLADPAVQVVHLASPNRLHYGQCKAALAAGKHLVCEKPLAMTSIETRELAELAEASSQVCAVSYNVRFYPLCLEARERIRRGDAGQVFHVSGAYVQDWLLYETDFNWRVLAEDGGELRAVADIGTHWLDLITFITGLQVEEVCADLRTFLPTRRRPSGSMETFQAKPRAPEATSPVNITTEDYGTMLLRFAGGATGALTVSQVTAGRKNCLRYELAGSQAALAWNSERPEELWIGHRDRPNELLLRDPALMTSVARYHSDYPGGHVEGLPDTFKHLYRAVYQEIERPGRPRRPGESPPLFATFRDGHREVLLCEAILCSHRERRWVTVPSF
jgi:predicted dehydrogenase